MRQMCVCIPTHVCKYRSMKINSYTLIKFENHIAINMKYFQLLLLVLRTH